MKSCGVELLHCFVLTVLTQVLWDELFTVVHDEDSPDVQLDVVLLLLVLKEVERCTTGNKEQGPELELTLH